MFCFAIVIGITLLCVNSISQRRLLFISVSYTSAEQIIFDEIIIHDAISTLNPPLGICLPLHYCFIRRCISAEPKIKRDPETTDSELNSSFIRLIKQALSGSLNFTT